MSEQREVIYTLLQWSNFINDSNIGKKLTKENLIEETFNSFVLPFHCENRYGIGNIFFLI